MIGPLAYIGGKRRLASTLVRLFPPHRTYVEPFAGGAQVLFAKTPGATEILNDLSGDIVNFFRVCQRHQAELVRCLRFLPASRVLFRQALAQDPTTLTDVERAARFLYLQKNAFGGLLRHRQFHLCVKKPSNYNPKRLTALLRATSERLARVQIESLPYEALLSRCDRAHTFFYIDPPYVGVKLYEFNFTDKDFFTLASQLERLKGKFLLSINDHPVARAAFKAFEMRPVELHYTVATNVPLKRELVFANYSLPALPDRRRTRHVA